MITVKVQNSLVDFMGRSKKLEVTQMKFIGTRLCPDCIDAESVLKQASIPFEYVDITGSTDNLKFFLNLRDYREEFNEIKKNGFVGIPCFMMEDGSLFFDENKIISLMEEEQAS